MFIMYKEILQVNNKMTNNLIFNWAKDLNTYFSKEDIKWYYNHVKDAQHHKSLGKYKSKLK